MIAAKTITPEQGAQLISAMTASKPEVNTSTSIHTNRIKLADQGLVKASLNARFKNEPKVSVRVPKPYGEQVGGFINLGINGITIEIPCDGIERLVPKSFADLLAERLDNLDAQASPKGFQIGRTEGLLAAGQTEQGDVRVDTRTYNG